MGKRSLRGTFGLTAMVALTLTMAACGDDVFGPNPQDVEFAASLGIDLVNMTESSTGLFYLDDVVGTGDAAESGDQVTLNYTGSLANGEQFDAGNDFVITLGLSNLIAGFTEGVTGMRVEGTRTIVIPSNLGYGSTASSRIPGNSVLVFELVVTAIVRP
ncbi:MAG TPA: FKBP-type peptidyl-prolyl cis-trans isomerase [Gemmatimonadetes bacterium]|nr:FKBP-type peptidyl-prolyl cis-trans isomerase [Gemmatimonadota bacterium]